MTDVSSFLVSIDLSGNTQCTVSLNVETVKTPFIIFRVKRGYDSDQENLDLKPGSTSKWQLTSFLWASISSSVKWEYISPFLPYKVVMSKNINIILSLCSHHPWMWSLEHILIFYSGKCQWTKLWITHLTSRVQHLRIKSRRSRALSRKEEWTSINRAIVLVWTSASWGSRLFSSFFQSNF